MYIGATSIGQAVATVDIERAVRLNRRYAQSLGWQAHFDRIARLLGFTTYTPDEKELAEAAARWQESKGLPVDGIIGPATWSRMKAEIGFAQPTATAPARQATTGAIPQAPFGALTASLPGRPPFTYAFTPEDVLWIARFITGEAGGRDDLGNRAVIWAMFNRYAFFTHQYYPMFHQFLRAYSTPLQPVLKSWGAAKRHMNKPEFVRTGGYYAPPHNDIPRGQLRRFLNLQATPWSQLPKGARSLAEQAVKGLVPNPIGNASEFGSTYVYFRDKYGRNPNDDEWRQFTETYARSKSWVWIGDVPGLNQKGNAFFVQRRVANLAPNTVRVVLSA